MVSFSGCVGLKVDGSSWLALAQITMRWHHVTMGIPVRGLLASHLDLNQRLANGGAQG